MNKHILSKFLLFAAGAAVGSAVTWKLMNETYKRMADEEIKSMREYFEGKYEDREPRSEEKDTDENAPVLDTVAIAECAEVIGNLGYTDYRNVTPNKEVNDVDEPYVISPEEFGELGDYETHSLTYFKDGILTDDKNVPLEDVDDVVGYDSLDHFGEYEDDSVFVRNDRLKADFEILLDSRRYADLINTNARPTEDE